MTNLVALKRPPSDLPANLRALADRAEKGEITDLVIALIGGGNFEFVYAASFSDCIVLSTLLLQNSVDRMRA